MMMSESAEEPQNHEWVLTELLPYEVCAKCGYVRNATSDERPCRGRVVVRPRCPACGDIEGAKVGDQAKCKCPVRVKRSFEDALWWVGLTRWTVGFRLASGGHRPTNEDRMARLVELKTMRETEVATGNQERVDGIDKETEKMRAVIKIVNEEDEKEFGGS